jgi:hypothetical protein
MRLPMAMMAAAVPRVCFSLFVLLHAVRPSLQASPSLLATVSIQSDAGYLGQRQCVENCLYQNLAGVFANGLPLFLGCVEPVYDRKWPYWVGIRYAHGR